MKKILIRLFIVIASIIGIPYTIMCFFLYPVSYILTGDGEELIDKSWLYWHWLEKLKHKNK